MRIARARVPGALATTIASLAVVGAVVAAGRIFDRGLPAGVIASGVVFGSLDALVAVGLVLIYRSTRVINFAQAELGTVAAVAGVHLSVNGGMNWFVAAAVAVALSAALAAAVEIVVIRRLANTPRLFVAVATIGLAQILTALALLLPRWLGTRSDLSGFRVPLGGVRAELPPYIFGGSEIFAVAVVPLVLAMLTFGLTRTARGLALRALPDNPERAFLVGMPVRGLGTLAWAVAGALSALAVVVRVPVLSFQGFDALAAGGPSLLLATLAAAVIGRMSSLPVTAGAAIALGIAGSVASWITSNTAIVDLMLVGVILVVLVGRRDPRGRRLDDDAPGSWRAFKPIRPVPHELRRLPEVRIAGAGLTVATAAAALTLPLWASPGQEHVAGLVAIYALIGVSLIVLTGWAGQISLGQFALAGAGAATTGVLLAGHGWDLFVALAAGAAVAAAVAAVIGLPALRNRGLSLAVTTIGFAIAGSAFLFDERSISWLIESSVPRPILFGRIAIDAEWKMYFLALAALALGLRLSRNLRSTVAGRAIVAVRDNPSAAASAGIAPVRAALSALAFSGALAGLAGGIYVIHQEGITTNAFPPGHSLSVFALAVIGGLGSLLGAVAGALYVVAARFWLHGPWTLLGTGVGLLLLLMFAPGGISDLIVRGRDAALRAVARRRGLVVASMIADDAGLPPSSDSKAAAEPVIASPLLRCRDVSVSRNGVRVVFGFNLDVAEGEVVAILGANGSGKSTVLEAISGLLEPDGGTIEFRGRRLRGRSPDIAAVPGGQGVFPSLTVDENLVAAAWSLRRRRAEQQRAIDDVFVMFPALHRRRSVAAGALSGGERRMLSLAQAFVARPRLLLIDELSLGLAPDAIDALAGVVHSLNEGGTTIVLVEQVATRAARLASRAVWMEKGRVRFAGSPAEIAAHDDLARARYVPAPTEFGTPALHSPSQNTVVLSVESVTKRYGGVVAVSDAGLAVEGGEIVGLIGPNGAGKTTLLDLISGTSEPDSGRIVVHGVDVTRWPSHRRARFGVARSFQDSRLWSSLTVREALAVALTMHARIGAMVPHLFRIPATIESEREIARRVDELIALFSLDRFAGKFVAELSTGSRRLVDLAGMVAQRPAVLLLDEPASGLAAPEADALAPLLRRVREQTGCGMIVVEHYLPLVRAVADRLVTLQAGSIVGPTPEFESGLLGVSRRGGPG